jgi:hypothetical protein
MRRLPRVAARVAADPSCPWPRLAVTLRRALRAWADAGRPRAGRRAEVPQCVRAAVSAFGELLREQAARLQALEFEASAVEAGLAGKAEATDLAALQQQAWTRFPREFRCNASCSSSRPGVLHQSAAARPAPGIAHSGRQRIWPCACAGNMWLTPMAAKRHSAARWPGRLQWLQHCCRSSVRRRQGPDCH